jgi:hypothetical protein
MTPLPLPRKKLAMIPLEWVGACWSLVKMSKILGAIGPLLTKVANCSPLLRWFQLSSSGLCFLVAM